jgi:ABC-type branched-subunit amino acid transport system substrate-binding protein
VGRALTTDLGISRIALFYQDDSFGLAGRSGIIAALKRRSMELVAEGTFVRNTTAVKTALLTIRKAEPQAVGMVGTYKACAEFIRLARRIPARLSPAELLFTIDLRSPRSASLRRYISNRQR